jgi:hypothetical protein
VARFRLCIVTALALSALGASLLRGQEGDEDSPKPKPTQHAPAKSPSPSPTSSAKKKKKNPTPKSDDEDSPTPKQKSSTAKPKSASSKSDDDEDETPHKAKSPAKPSKTPSATAKSKSGKKKAGAKDKSSKESPAKKKKSTPEPENTRKPQPAKTPAAETTTPRPPHAGGAVPQPSEHPSPAPSAAPSADNSAQLTIEKSGFEESQGLAPTPSPPPKRFWLWPWSRSRSTAQHYNYLTRSVIDQIRRAPVASNRWKFIVVHNSGTRQGNARVFDYYHRHVRRMQNGLAYHFVIGNGTSSGNGEIEVGDRWRRQINGGHVHSDYLNNISLGICLVGDFNRDQPTKAQLDACEELIRYLRERCGKADGRPIPVKPHKEVNPPRWATDCPGDAFPYAWFRKF